MKVRRVGLPCSHASISPKGRPKSRLSRSFILFPPRNVASGPHGRLLLPCPAPPPAQALRPSGILDWFRPPIVRRRLSASRFFHAGLEDVAWLTTLRERGHVGIDHRLDVLRAAAGEALIGPAERAAPE
jgi:hypothetical protein